MNLFDTLGAEVFAYICSLGIAFFSGHRDMRELLYAALRILGILHVVLLSIAIVGGAILLLVNA